MIQNPVNAISNRWLRLAIYAGVALLLVLLVMASWSWLHDANVDRKDTKADQRINQHLTNANAHGAKADQAGTERKALEEQTTKAKQRRATVTAEREQATKRVAEATTDYEKTLNSQPGDYPVLTDIELCTRLSRLNISCVDPDRQ